MKNLYTRIIGGKYKGKKVLLPSLEVTRSSKSILKESLFNTLQYDIIDKNFVEVFAGSGSVGLEALSRGAGHIYFIEIDKNSFDILNKNAKSFNIDRCTLIYGDAFDKIFDVIDELRRKKQKAYFYFDPPFSIREGKEDIYEKVMDVIKKIPKEVVIKIIIEHMTKVNLPKQIGKYMLEKRRKFGKSSISYYV